MKKHGNGGVILVTASIAGMVGGGARQPIRRPRAVISLIENVAAELGGDRIRVVGIAPGVISTPLVHRGRPKYEKQFGHQPWPDRGEPDGIADVAAFLCSTMPASSPARPSRSTAAFWRRALRCGARARTTLS